MAQEVFWETDTWPKRSTQIRAGGLPGFPPKIVVAVKALACELSKRFGPPLSRFSLKDLKRHVQEQGIIASISDITIWRWLSKDAVKPWQNRSWIFPRDPQFVAKAAPILDLYQKMWQGITLRPNDYVVSTDEKTSIQARRRKAEPLPPKPGVAMRVEHEYERKGAFAYLAAWDVHRAKIFGHCGPKTGIKPFERLVEHVMNQKPYRSARRVFWIMDNGSCHRGVTSDNRIVKRWENIIAVHTPVHASWLNQVEVYFSVVQRKVLTPTDAKSISELESRILSFQEYYEAAAAPFKWKFTRSDLDRLMAKLEVQTELREAA
jgi:hypothetical protein